MSIILFFKRMKHFKKNCLAIVYLKYIYIFFASSSFKSLSVGSFLLCFTKRFNYYNPHCWQGISFVAFSFSCKYLGLSYIALISDVDLTLLLPIIYIYIWIYISQSVSLYIYIYIHTYIYYILYIYILIYLLECIG